MNSIKTVVDVDTAKRYFKCIWLIQNQAKYSVSS